MPWPAAAASAAARAGCEQVCIWTPDKDLAQCVVGDRVVQIDRRNDEVRDEAGVREKFGVAAGADPRLPGAGRRLGRRLSRHPRHRAGQRGALLRRHGSIEAIPDEVLGQNRELALLFKNLATLRADEPLFDDADAMRWTGPGPAFADLPDTIADEGLRRRVAAQES